MFAIRFKTKKYRGDATITIRGNVEGWDHDVPGNYQNDEWVFELSKEVYNGQMELKFVLEKTYWMSTANIVLNPIDGYDYIFDETDVQFEGAYSEVLIENGRIQELFFAPELEENNDYDVIVIGSGAGGGIVADQLSDLGVNVLVLEAGSYLFPTHVANLPRKHLPGKFDKHIWKMYENFKVTNFQKVDGTNFEGGQAFNLGGRSLFWGGLIPRMTSWELDAWPRTTIRWYLEDSGYQRAEDLMNRTSQPPSAFHQTIKQFLKNNFGDYNHFDAPMAVNYSNDDLATIPTGLFSTADLLMESRLTDADQANNHLTINLNHAVTKLVEDNGKIVGVEAYDLIANKKRTYKGQYVILAAGTIESAKIAMLSNLQDPNQKIGKGITDHPIYYTHFAVPANTPYFNNRGSSKVLSQHKQAAVGQHPYNVVLELGSDFNQGRYVDDDILKRHQEEKGNTMLCEVVFLFNSPLVEQNQLQQNGPSVAKPLLTMQKSPSADHFYNEINDYKNKLLNLLGAIPLAGENLDLKPGGLGGVAHEVGTLRLSEAANGGVVDTNLQFRGYDNLYVCDLSVFPTSPAANPTLTLAALAIRLADHLRDQLHE